MYKMLLFGICLVFQIHMISTRNYTAEELLKHLAIDNCDHLRARPEAVLPEADVNGLRCITSTNEVESIDIYSDNERMAAGEATIYTVFQGLLNCYDKTPQYCFDRNNNLASYYLNFDSKTPNMKTRIEMTACRNAGYWTNGKVFCSPPECSKYLRQPKDTDYFEEEMYVTLNMNDVSSLKMRKSVIITQFHGSPDHRLIYNITTNQTHLLSTDEFLNYCTLYGPCYKGKFHNRSDILYLFAGFPPLIMKRDKRGTIYIGVRYDPRDFVLLEKIHPRPCLFKSNIDYELCESPTGYHSWKRLWQKPLPYHKEWLALHWFVRWSYKQDCIIKVTDTETGEVLVDYTGPCGRHVDMKMGNYPYLQLGMYNGGVNVPVKMRFKDIKIIQTGSKTIE